MRVKDTLAIIIRCLYTLVGLIIAQGLFVHLMYILHFIEIWEKRLSNSHTL